MLNLFVEIHKLCLAEAGSRKLKECYRLGSVDTTMVKCKNFISGFLLLFREKSLCNLSLAYQRTN